MQTTDEQVRRLLEEYGRCGRVDRSAMRSGMHRNTARKYLKAGTVPSAMKVPRTWRTREDPFEEVWGEVAARLVDAPELEAKTLFEDLIERYPERFQQSQLRTLQRRVKDWRARYGPDREVFFAQAHRPGELSQTDFTWATELGITIQGELLEHMLCHVVLPYCNWQWATVCFSESVPALKRGVQEAFFRLGRVTETHQTDNSTSATHDLRTGKRGLNREYLELVQHLGMKARTTRVGAKEQNGDVEAANGALKRRLRQHLLLRGSGDFESREAYEVWLRGVLEKANSLRQIRLAEELAVMRPLAVDRLPEYREREVRVTSWSTIRVNRNTYSVPSRLIGERVRVRIYDERIELFYKGSGQMVVERLRGEQGHRINYRHVIWSLVQKPGAFSRYRYREDLFPSLVFRRAYDALTEALSTWKADVEYLKVLHLAARTVEADVEAALEEILGAGEVPVHERVKARVVPAEVMEVPRVADLEGDPASYDGLLDCALDLSA